AGASTYSANAVRWWRERRSWAAAAAAACCAAAAAAAARSAEHRARHGVPADQAGARVGADHRAHLRGEHRIRAEDLAAALDQALRLPRCLDVLHDPRVRTAVVHLLRVADHALERPPGRAHALDRHDFV